MALEHSSVEFLSNVELVVLKLGLLAFLVVAVIRLIKQDVQHLSKPDLRFQVKPIRRKRRTKRRSRH